MNDQSSTASQEPWRDRLWHVVRRALPFAGGMIATLAAMTVYNAFGPKSDPITINDVNEAVAEAIASVTPAPAYSAQVYQIVRPSLVLIQTRAPGDDEEEGYGLGSGVVITTNGDILTSLHVIEDAKEIRLTFADGTESSGQMIAADPSIDIAVVRANTPPAEVVPAVLGNPNAMRVGDEVYAVGNPFGLYSSMSAGVISGFNRTFQPTDSHMHLEGLIQIDAAVNPGNSGGPLLNRAGQVIAIITGIVSPKDGDFFIGIGFAVPITTAAAAAGAPPY